MVKLQIHADGGTDGMPHQRNMSAGWRIVFDRNCHEDRVMANTASQKVIEEQHNASVLDTIAAKTAEGGTLFGKHGHHEGTLQADRWRTSPVSGLESLYYKEIGSCAPRHHPERTGTD